MSTFSAAFLLFLILDPLGNIPVFLTTLKNVDPGRWLDWLAATVLAWLCTSLILMSSTRLNRLLGPRGLLALERLMGMLLVTVAIDMLIDGIKLTFFVS